MLEAARKWSGLIAALSMTACSSAEPSSECPASYVATPVASATGKSSGVALSLRTGDGLPPPRGVSCVVLDATRAGVPVDGLTLTGKLWMPAMGHGSSVEPSISAISSGRYLVRNLSLSMAGTWEVHITVGGARDDVMLTWMVP